MEKYGLNHKYCELVNLLYNVIKNTLGGRYEKKVNFDGASVYGIVICRVHTISIHKRRKGR